MRRAFRAALLALALTGGGCVPELCPARVPVGIRSNNPSNIHGVRWWIWQGAVSTDGYHYLRFKSPYYGLRAMKIVLDAYYHRHGLNTVAGIRNRWVRRPTTARQVRLLREDILLVSKLTGVWPNTPLDLDQPQVEIRLAKAIIYAENSRQPYPDSLFRQVFGQ